MNHESAKALAWAAGILMVLALMVMSPSGSFALLLLALICAAVPAAFASRRVRFVSIALLVAAIALAASIYPAFEREQKAYMQRARSTKTQAATPTDQGVIKK